MAFTEAEKRQWHADREAGRSDDQVEQGVSSAICGHCGNPFRLSDGVVTSEFALCDVCNGD